MSGLLHVIRVDVLLYALGGFERPDPVYDYGIARVYPDWLGRKILEIARKPRAARGEIADLSETSGRSRHSLSAVIYEARRGRIPKYRTAEKLVA